MSTAAAEDGVVSIGVDHGDDTAEVHVSNYIMFSNRKIARRHIAWLRPDESLHLTDDGKTRL